MSRFSGKCDFADTISIYGIDFIIKNCKIFQNNKELKLNKHSIIKYFPYLVSSMGMSKGSDGTINLTSESYVDSQNKERIKWYLEDLQKIKESEKPFFENSLELRIIKSIDEDNSLSSERKEELINSFQTNTAIFFKVELCKEYIKDYYTYKILQKDIYSLVKELDDCFEIYRIYSPLDLKKLEYFESFEEIKNELYRINFGTNKKM